MLHTLQSATTPTSDTVLRAMFAARKSVFVDLLKWDVPVIDGRYEIDQFDDEHATYLVLADAGGRHLGSARLLPTLRPHLLDSLYPSLCEATPPRGAAIAEITRFCLDRSLSAAARRRVRDTLVVALVDHARDHGIVSYSAIAAIAWFQQILAFGWRCQPLGIPRILDGQMLAALRIAIEPGTRACLAAAGIVPDPVTLGIERRIAA